MRTREFTRRNPDHAPNLLPLVECVLNLRRYLGDEGFLTGIRIAKMCLEEDKRPEIAQTLMAAGIETDRPFSALITGEQLAIVYGAFQEDFDQALAEKQE